MKVSKEKIYRTLEEEGPIQEKELKRKVGIPWWDLRKHLKELIEERRVKKSISPTTRGNDLPFPILSKRERKVEVRYSVRK